MLRNRTAHLLVHRRHKPTGVPGTLDVIAVGDNGVGAKGTERP